MQKKKKKKKNSFGLDATVYMKITSDLIMNCKNMCGGYPG